MKPFWYGILIRQCVLCMTPSIQPDHERGRTALHGQVRDAGNHPAICAIRYNAQARNAQCVRLSDTNQVRYFQLLNAPF